MRYYALAFLSIFFCDYMHAQCERTVKVIFTSINYKSGCEFSDAGGIDPTLDLYDNTGDRIYNSHYGNQSQVTGPQNNVPIDFNITVNPCGNFSNSFTLGTFPIDVESFEVTADTYEKDSNFLNDQCGPYNLLFDRNYASGLHTFDFTQSFGLLDVGGCMTYNYQLEMTSTGTLVIDLEGPICPNDTLIIDNVAYHQLNPLGSAMIPGFHNTCDTLYNIDLSFHDEISFQLMGPAAICPGEITKVFLDSSFESYEWSNGSSLDTLTTDEAGFYSVIVTSTNGCTSESSIQISDLPTQGVSIEGDDSFCPDSSSEIFVTNGGNALQWSTGETSDTIDVRQAGQYFVSLTDSNGCVNIDSITVSERAQPNPIITGELSFCKGDSTIIEVNQNYMSYLWSDQSNQIDLTIKESGDYGVTVTDQNGCTASQMTNIEEFDLPTPTLTGSSNICMGMPIILRIDETYDFILWDNGMIGNEITVTSAGNYNVTVTDSNGCTASLSRDITETTQLTPTVTGLQEICEGEMTTLSVTEDQVSYLWDDGSTDQSLNVTATGDYGLTITDTNGCTGSTLISVKVIPQIITELDSLTCYQDQVGIKEIELVNTDGCTDIIRYNIEYDILGECSIGYFITGRSETCPGANDAVINIEVLDGVYPVTVELYDEDEILLRLVELQSGENILNIGGLARGNYIVFVTGDNGDFKTGTLDRNRSGELPILYDELVNINSGESVLLSAEIDTTFLESYFWALDGMPLCTQNCLSLSVTPEESTTYQFLATHDTLACNIEVETEVIVIPPQDLYIPTIFSLSALGEDSQFLVSGPGTSYISSLSIYDRWGNLIHQAEGTNLSWDGHYDGHAIQSGVYLYVIRLANPLENTSSDSYRSGSITVIK